MCQFFAPSVLGAGPLLGACIAIWLAFCHLTMVFPEFLTFVSALSFRFTQFPLEFALVASWGAFSCVFM